MRKQKTDNQKRLERAEQVEKQLGSAFKDLEKQQQALPAKIEAASEAWFQAMQDKTFCELQIFYEEYPSVLDKIHWLHIKLLCVDQERLTPEQINLREELNQRYGNPDWRGWKPWPIESETPNAA